MSVTFFYKYVLFLIHGSFSLLHSLLQIQKKIMFSGNYYRSWMDKPHLDPNTKLLTEEYAEGVGEFMRLVHQQPEANTGMLRCLCSSCNNNRILREWDVRTHLYMRGFTQNYKVWCLHVENGYEYGSTSEPQHVESIFVCSIRMSLVPCRLSSLFSNPAESISVCSIRIHKDTQLGKVFSF